ncbi:MAG: tRNA dihydrouridine synthase DusB [Acidobacteriota bacterium]
MKIGHIDLGYRPLLLAPMEDVSDPPFRILCKRHGADLVYTEFISSGGLVHEAADSLKKLEFHEEERPVAIQIFGGDLAHVTEAVEIVDAVGPDIIDLNFGCPVRKVVCQDAGAAILKDLPKMRRLAEAVVSRTSRPVTVKTRLGWCEESIRILEVARLLQDCGIQALAVHARTRSQMYKGQARWEWLRRLKEEADLRIPLIGNGDATTPEKVREMFEQTGVDAVMIGRGAIGNPWIFRDARHLLRHGQLPPPVDWLERLRTAAEHLELKCRWLGEKRGVLEMRKMYAGYFKGMPGASALRTRLMEITELRPALDLLDQAVERYVSGNVPAGSAVDSVAS